MCVTHGGGRRCEAEGCDGVPLQGRRVCKACAKERLDEMLKQVTEARIARQAAEAAEAEAAHWAALARIAQEGGRLNATEKGKGAE
jgi:hypothetical protein